MERIKTYITPLLLIVPLLLTSCGVDQELSNLPEDGNSIALSLLPEVENTTDQPLSRASNHFFKNDDEISLSIVTNHTAEKLYQYVYKDGTFNGKDAVNSFFFGLDNTSITTLVASWPSQEAKEAKGIIQDQRPDENFQQADELEARVEQCNIMPTAAPLPLVFKHKQSRLSFQLAGQNANGLIIESLILELKYYDSADGTEKPGAFWAHCNNSELAELILPAQTSIKAENASSTVNSGERYMIGMVTLSGKTQYTGGIWVSKLTSVELKAGYEYIVTLTPEGYNLVASFEIHGFGQNEGYIGIPIQLPTPVIGESNQYTIENSNQLVTLSHLLAGDINIESKEYWAACTYTFNTGFTMLEKAKAWYKPIANTLSKLFPDGSNGFITQVTDYEGNTFPLFATISK